METIKLLTVMGVVRYISMDTPLSRYAAIYGNVTLCPGQSAGEILHAESAVSCSVSCERHNTTCSMARYTATTGECVLYHWTSVGTVSMPRDPSNLIPTEVIIRYVDSHILVGEIGKRHNIAFQEAPSFRARFGGRVSSLTDLTAARDLGWDFCKSGWLNDGFAYLWMLTIQWGCGETRFNECNQRGGRTTFDVHCTI